jgi:ATP:ADP antiporter, AAA family
VISWQKNRRKTAPPFGVAIPTCALYRADRVIRQPTMNSEQEHRLERFLGLFTEVRRGEGVTALLLMSNLFILLTAYYVIKTVREPLILVGGGAEVKSYAAAGQALLLVLALPLYGWLATKVNRIRLINWVTLFFISNLVAFYFVAQFQVAVGLVFFLWVGIFNLLLMAQFWSFANDIYTREQGQRLFAIVAAGGSLGAIVGPIGAAWMFRPLGPYPLMLVAAVLLTASMVIAKIVDAREKRAAQGTERTQDNPEKPLGQEGGFELVFGQRYLLWIALLMVIANVINTTGEFILGKAVMEEAQRLVAAGHEAAGALSVAASDAAGQTAKAQSFVGEFYGNFFFWVNLSQAVIQVFFVSRIIKYFGVAGALLFLPLIALGSYALIAAAPLLSYIRFAKVLENSTDYSLQNTARHSLFLPTSREAKYKAKAAIDTFFVRIGDVLAAALVFIGSSLVLNTGSFAMINVALVGLWLLLAAVIGRHYKLLGQREVNTAT